MKSMFSFATLFLVLMFVSEIKADEIFVRISDNQDFRGESVDLTELKFVSGFGEVNFPLASVNGIKLNANGKGDAIVVFKNGDTISGKLLLDVVKVKTSWGQAHINTSAIDAITFDTNGRFYSEKNGSETTWRFTNEPPVTEPASSSRPLLPQNPTPNPNFGGVRQQ